MTDTHKPEEDERQAALDLIKQHSGYAADGIDDLFEGWDHDDIALVRDAIIASAAMQEIRDALTSKKLEESNEPWFKDTYVSYSSVRFRNGQVQVQAGKALKSVKRTAIMGHRNGCDLAQL